VLSQRIRTAVSAEKAEEALPSPQNGQNGKLEIAACHHPSEEWLEK
jgi:hypothetical protein